MHTSLRTALVLLLATLGWAGRSNAQSSFNGDRFWFGFMANYGGGGGAQLRVYIAGDQATSGTISMPNMGWSTTFTVPANGTTMVLIPLSAICTSSDTIQGKGILIEAGRAVTVHALNFEQATADASVILPESLLGTDHRVMAYKGLQGFGTLNSELLVVATEDSTEVEIVPACNTLGGHAAGVAFTVQLQQGETFFLEAADAADDLTGTRVRIPSPVGCQRLSVFGGSQCTNIPVGCFACDHLYEQLIPVHEWGTRYFLTPFTGPTVYTYRVLAHEDSTHYTVNGTLQPMLMAGQYQEVNAATLAGCIEADKPVSVAQYMQGQDCSGGYGDPAMVLLPSDNDPTTHITFSTASSLALTIHTLNVVMDSSNIGLFNLDGNTVPAQSFNSFTQCPDRVWAALPLTDGVHTASVTNGFSGIVYGTGPNYETYAYSLGIGSQASLDSVICSGSSAVTLTAPVGYGLAIWSFEDTPFDTLAVGPTFTYTPLSNAVVIVRDTTLATVCDGAGRYRFELTNSQLTVALSANTDTVCAPAQILLTALADPDSLCLTYSWSPSTTSQNMTGDTVTAVLFAPTQFSVTVTTPLGCSLATDSILITAFVPPTPVISETGGTLVCNPVAVTYAWYFNGLAIPGASAPLYTPTQSGSYVVGVTDANGCEGFSVAYPFILNGITGSLALPIQVWSPGPEALRLEGTTIIERVEVFTALGQLTTSIAPRSTSVTMPVPGAGVYLVHIHAAGITETRRMMVMD